MSIIAVNDVTKQYSNKRGIRHITLNVEKGDIVGILGPNGSGKTTLLKVLTGICHSNSGAIEMFGENQEEYFPEIMKRTGVLIEAPAIFKDMSAWKNLKMTAMMYKVPDERIETVLEAVHLESYKNEKAGRFSLGMKQRLGIAKALLHNPELIILDEPTNGLDIEGVVEIRELILDLNKRYQTTFIVSSHIASEIEKMCNRIYILSEGELIDKDEIEHILQMYSSVEAWFIDIVKSKRGGAVL